MPWQGPTPGSSYAGGGLERLLGGQSAISPLPVRPLLQTRTVQVFAHAALAELPSGPTVGALLATMRRRPKLFSPVQPSPAGRTFHGLHSMFSLNSVNSLNPAPE